MVCRRRLCGVCCEPDTVTIPNDPIRAIGRATRKRDEPAIEAEGIPIRIPARPLLYKAPRPNSVSVFKVLIHASERV